MLFAVFTFFSGVWNLGAFMVARSGNDYNASFFWWKVGYIGAICASASFLPFVIKYVGSKKVGLAWTVSVLAVFFVFFNWYKDSRYFLGDLRYVFNSVYWVDALKYKNPIFFPFYSILYWVTPAYSFFLLWKKFRNSAGIERNRLKYFILAVGFGWIGTNPLWLPAFHVDFYPYTNFLVATYPLVVAYVIIRHHVMDINLVMTRTGNFLIVYTLVLGTPFVLGYKYGQWKIATWVMLVLASSGPFIYQYLKRRTDNIILKKQRRSQGILLALSKRMTRLRCTSELFEAVGTTTVDAVEASYLGIYLKDEEHNSFKIQFSHPKKDKSRFEEFLPLDHPIIKLLYEQKKPLLTSEVSASTD